MFICKLIYSCKGSFSKRSSQTIFITQVLSCFEKTTLGQPDSPPALAQAHSHTVPQKTTHAMKTIPDPNTSFVTTP
jgi:hypothetical protein